MFTINETPGTRLTRKQVLFSWALAESYSPRWREDMRTDMNAAMRKKHDANEIKNWTEEEQDILIQTLNDRGERWGFLTDYIDVASEFYVIDIPVEALEWIPVLHTFSQKPYPVCLGHYIDWGFEDSWENDPRVHAERQWTNPPKIVYRGYPMIGYRQEIKSDVLFEGYVRCITALWKHRAGEKVAPIRMIYCAMPEDRKARAEFTNAY